MEAVPYALNFPQSVGIELRLDPVGLFSEGMALVASGAAKGG